MRIAGWVCVTCGRCSTRQSNMKRHIRLCHAGDGQFVSSIDYIAGRSSGIYRPSLTPKYESKKIAKFDILDSLDYFTREFYGELGRQKARQVINEGHQQQQTQSEQTGAHTYSSYLQVNAGQVFGFRVKVCMNCVLFHITTISFCENGRNGRLEERHGCSSNLNKVSDKDASIKAMDLGIPAIMKELVKKWTRNETYLLAIHLPSSRGDRGQEKNIKVSNPRLPQQFITFQHSDENVIGIDLANETEQHWAARALKYKVTKLDDNDLNDFFRRVKNATFAVVNVMTSSSISKKYQSKTNLSEAYFMAIVPQDMLQPKDSELKKEERPLTSGLDRQDKELVGLYNDLLNISTLEIPTKEWNG